MTDIDWVFFDIGGVLGTNGWDTVQRTRAVERFHLDAEEFQRRHIETAGPWEEGRIAIDEYLDFTIFYCPQAFTREQFKDFMFGESQPFVDSTDVAREIAALDRYTMMTLNNEAAELNTFRIEKFGLDSIFEAFMSSCWLGSRKPMKKIYTDALSIAQAVPSRTLFIDDRERNLVPARELGINTILFENAAKLRDDLAGILGTQTNGA